ncbi:diguanylate cyclase (GGDEF)-like protein [Paenibacillus baekrokdamisoli]|nr:ATP-binding protein [Paenibacillus baekrokdamisoli]MBB3073433.1 diguanylate cyclase (GGDEF)-like protein [Paenibacillus baekrokdamisoli]
MEIRNRRHFRYTLSISAGYSLLYTSVRLTYHPWDEYNLLVSIYDLFSFMLVVFVIQYILTAELERKRLQKRNKFLTFHDPLTNLLNYDGYINAVNDLVDNKKSNFVLLLLDFQDFKSINKESISCGNEILTKISIIIQTYFSNAVAISRYAGDRFALAIPTTENAVSDVQEILESRSLGYEVTYSMAMFPEEGSSSQQIITLAEDRLFQNKRVLWLKREEELFRSEKLKMVGELAAGMAHEIRNPLTTLKGFIDLSKSQSYNIGPWVDIITNEITRMNELTAEFLQFSKPHMSNMKPEPISGCLDRVKYLTESQAVSKGHCINLYNIDESILVVMDRDKIVQVLINLVRNALEAMVEPGHIHIQVKRMDTKHTVIEIQDTGKGIPEDVLPKIFDPFYTTKEEGTGLGLSICHKIIQDHNGILSVKSIVNEGSLFTITLPVI